MANKAIKNLPLMQPDDKQLAGYIQLLMQEGKLEEEIIEDTCTLFNIERKKAERLIHEYKSVKPERYKENIVSNVKQRLLLIVPLILFG